MTIADATLLDLLERAAADVRGRDLADRLRAGARALERRMRPPLVLVAMPGYWLVGSTAAYREVPAPDLEGLDDFHRIVLNGAAVDAVLAAETLVEPGKAPGAALRGRLKRAAEWFDRVCPDLAVEVRAVKVDNAGCITRTPGRPILIDLEAVLLYADGDRNAD